MTKHIVQLTRLLGAAYTWKNHMGRDPLFIASNDLKALMKDVDDAVNKLESASRNLINALENVQ